MAIIYDYDVMSQSEIDMLLCDMCKAGHNLNCKPCTYERDIPDVDRYMYNQRNNTPVLTIEEIDELLSKLVKPEPEPEPIIFPDLEPRWLNDEKRAKDIILCMKAYNKHGKEIPEEWFEELSELHTRIRKVIPNDR